MTVRERLFALWYPAVTGLAERAGNATTRSAVLACATGRTLELGAGSGLNLARYPASVTDLVLTEPSAAMVARLRAAEGTAHGTAQETAHGTARGTARVVRARAGALPFADASFDTVVSAFVQCSVPDPAAALAEVARVLRPGGRYLFLEHVRDPRNGALARMQDVLAPVHVWAAAGCHPNRDVAALLDASPLEVEDLIYGTQPRSAPTVRPTLHGSARRPADTAPRPGTS